MHDEGEANIAMNWVVAGKQSMEMHGYLPSNQDQPAVMVKTSGSGVWTFKFTDRKGTGRIQVSKGADYNPLDLIETLYHHITQMPRETQKNPKAQNIDYDEAVVSFDADFVGEWT